MKAQRDSASFVLRFTHDQWQDTQGKPRVEWRGHIRHVQDGAEHRFVDMVEALAFIEDCLLRLTESTNQQEDAQFQEQALRESCRLWEHFALSYAEHLARRLGEKLECSPAASDEPTSTDEGVGVASRVWMLRQLVGALEDRLDRRPLIQDASL